MTINLTQKQIAEIAKQTQWCSEDGQGVGLLVFADGGYRFGTEIDAELAMHRSEEEIIAFIATPQTFSAVEDMIEDVRRIL